MLYGVSWPGPCLLHSPPSLMNFNIYSDLNGNANSVNIPACLMVLHLAQWVFTKLLKPVYATPRQMGHISVAYIDDSYLQAATARACEQNVHYTVSLFTRLGFTVHPDKSVLKPPQELVFLGFVLNSRTMTFSLTRENKIVWKWLFSLSLIVLNLPLEK